VSDLLYQRLRQLPKGDLSRVRANLVKQDTLHQLAVDLGLPACIRLGEGEMRSGGKKRPSILADALEAVIGAVYLDAGICRRPATGAPAVQGGGDQSDHGGDRQGSQDRVAGVAAGPQDETAALPGGRYLGAAHQQSFDVECEIVELGLCERGIGGSRRAAEQAAAAAMLQTLKSRMQHPMTRFPKPPSQRGPPNAIRCSTRVLLRHGSAAA
jgi:ribonuclease-3